MKKRLTVLALAVTLTLSAFSGCATMDPAPVAEIAEAASAEREEEEPDSAGGMRFIDVSPNEIRKTYYTGVFEEFEAFTGIPVTYESVPWDDAANKLTILGASGQLPDVLTTWGGWLGQFTSADWVIPLERYLVGTEEEYNEVVRKIVWASEKELYGGIYTVPNGILVKGVFVRKDWCEALGIELDPAAGWTYDEYFDLVAQLTDVSQNRYGTSYRGARGGFDPLMVYLEGFHGGSLYADDGSILINSPQCLEAFERWTGLYLDGYAPAEAIHWGFSEMVDNFTSGVTGTLINDSEVAATCQDRMEDGTWMVMPAPRSADGKLYNTVNSPYAYSISTHAENPDDAWSLIEFLTRPDVNIEYCKMGGYIPIKKDVSSDDSYGPDGIYGTFVAQLNDPDLMVPCAFGPFDYTDMHQGMLHEEVQKYLQGNQTSGTALGNITRELENRMKKYLTDNPGATVEKPKSLS